MRKTVWLSVLLLVLLCPKAGGQVPVFNARYSEPLAVFVFVKQLASHQAEHPFRHIFNRSKYNTENYQQLISQFQELNLDYSYNFDEYPYGSKVPGMTEALLKKNLIAAANLEEFKLRSLGLIPNHTLYTLSHILTAFIPVYHELVYHPGSENFRQQLARFSAAIKNKNVPAFFETALRFYQVSWDAGIPFEMAFYPLPESNGFTAEAFYNNAVSAVPSGLKNDDVLLSVMLHEIFHILYDEQSLQAKQELEKLFSQHPAACSRYAYLLLNEVLATALGNGYVYESLAGKPDSGEWYHFKHINLMAKKIYPLLLEYVRLKKPMDKNFVEAYINTYQEHYPHWLNDPEHIFSYRFVLSENQADFGIFSQLYPNCSFFEYQDEISEASLQRMRSVPLTKVIIISKEHKARLELIRKYFPELKHMNQQASQEFSYHTFLPDKTQLFIINQWSGSTADLLKKLYH